MKDEAGLGRAIHWVQQALISASEDSCPLTPVKTGRQSLKWTSELESLRRVRRLFSKCRTDNNPHSSELYRQAQRRYRKEVRKASKDAWRTFLVPLTCYPVQLRYTRIFLGTPKIKLGPLVDPSGRRTQSKGEIFSSY